MNFLNKSNSFLAVVCLYFLQLSGCYAGPVRSAVEFPNILSNTQLVTRSSQQSLQDYYIPYDEEGDLAVTANESFIGLPTTENFGVEEPQTINDTGFSLYLPEVSGGTEQPALALDTDIMHSGLTNSDDIDTATPSDIQGVIEAESTQKLEEPSHSQTIVEQEPLSENLVPLVLIETSEFHQSSTVAPPPVPAELPLVVLVPTPISVANLPLETFITSISTTSLPEKVEINSSPEVQDLSSALLEPEQEVTVGYLPLDLDSKVKTQISSSSISFQSQIQVDQPKCYSNASYDRIANDNPNEKDGASNRSFKLRQLGFPLISNTQDNFDVQVNWAKFM